MEKITRKKSLFAFIVAMQALLIPIPGRFVFGITLIIELNLIMVLGTLASELIKILNLENMKTTLILFFNIAITIFFRQILSIFQAEVVLTLGFLIYIPSVSLFIIGYMYENTNLPLKEALKINQMHVVNFSIFALIYFLFRDLFAFGTFTFYGTKHQIFEKVIINQNNNGLTSFFASLPGAFLLSAILIYVLLYIKNKFTIISKQGELV